MSIDAIFLDLGGVVLEVNWKPVLVEMGFTDPESQKKIFDKVADWEMHRQFERGEVSETEFFSSLGVLIEKPDTELLRKSWNKMLIGELPGINDIFNQLQGRLPVYALSNTNPTHVNFLKTGFPVMKRFDHLFTSFELGHRKPETETFLKAARLADHAPQNILFIDDNPDNIEAANNLGFKTGLSVNSTIDTLRIIEKHL